jgi:cell division protein FtsZ
VDEAANRIRSEVDPDANIIVGSTFADQLEGRIRVSVVATGIDADISHAPMDMPAAASHAAARRLIRPLTSTSSAVSAGGYNPVSATIRELAERVQDMPGEDPRASAAQPVTIAQAPPMPQATVQAPAMQVRAEPERRPAASLATAAISVSATMQAPGALGPAERPTRASVEAQEDPTSRKRRVSNILERMTAKTFLSGGDTPAAAQAAQVQPQAPASRERAQAESAGRSVPERSAPTLSKEAEGERHAASSLEEEQLEIPTFLRRQVK